MIIGMNNPNYSPEFDNSWTLNVQALEALKTFAGYTDSQFGWHVCSLCNGVAGQHDDYCLVSRLDRFLS